MRVTRHALERAKERSGLSKSAARNLATRALECGLTRSDVVGPLGYYLDGRLRSHGHGNNMRVYGENVFIFHNEVLITVFPLPASLKRAASKLMKRKRERVESISQDDTIVDR